MYPTDAEGKARHHSLAAPDGTSLAYARLPALSEGVPGVMFCGGFKSDMTGTKARRLEAFCAARGRAYVRFDYRGHGASGGVFTDAIIGHWRDDALTILDRATEGPQILVGSSMGAWIAVLAALARPERVAALVTIAAAPDFTEDLIWARLDDAQRRTLAENGVLLQPSAYDDQPYPFTRALIEDGRRHLILRAPIQFEGPARLLHGLADPDAPWERSLHLAEALAGSDVRVTLIKDGDHRLSRNCDLALLETAVDEVSAAVTGAAGGPGKPAPG